MASTIRFGSGVMQRYANLQSATCGYPEVRLLYGNADPLQYIDSARRSNAALIPRPVSLCAQIPPDIGRDDGFVEQLGSEIELVAPLFDDDRIVVHLRFCGWPDRLEPATLARLVAAMSRHFHLADAARFDFRIDMEATAANVARIAASRAAGAARTEVVLTFGQVSQAPDAFAAVLGKLIDAQPDAIDLRDGALVQACRQSATTPDAAARLAMLEFAINQLVSRDYHHVGKGTFALSPDSEPTSKYDLIGVGPGAMSSFGDGVFQNPTSVSQWQQLVSAGRRPHVRGTRLDVRDRLRADALRRLLYAGRLDIHSIERRFGISFDKEFAEALDELGKLEALGLVQSGDGYIVTTSHGRYLWHIIAACFDPDSRPARRRAQCIECDVEESQRGDIAQQHRRG